MTTHFQIGELSLDRIVESEFPVLEPKEVYPDCTTADLESDMSWLVPRFYDRVSEKLILSFQGFLVRSLGKNILVDTCVGDCKERRRSAFNNQDLNWLEVLRGAGCEPEDVNVVICTHFHVDHVGWNTKLIDGQWKPTFPNARYLFAREEWDYWRGGEGSLNIARTGDYMADSILPVVEAGLVDFVAMDHRVDENISLMPAPGHTPGMVCVNLLSNGQQAIIAGDLLHTLLQVVHPEWSTRFCADPTLSRQTRIDFLDRYADTEVLIFPAHFPSPTGGYIVRTNQSFKFRFMDEVQT
jgi:glyoxylase-like metal-dependent hydrolase (beta-lactamase superfamily II)